MITTQKYTRKPRSSFNKQTKREHLDRERRQLPVSLRSEIADALDGLREWEDVWRPHSRPVSASCEGSLIVVSTGRTLYHL